jgi:hypothetical protein
MFNQIIIQLRELRLGKPRKTIGAKRAKDVTP